MSTINKDYKIVISAEDKLSIVLDGISKKFAGLEQQIETIRNVSAIGFASVTTAIGLSAHEAIKAEDSLRRASTAVKLSGGDWGLLGDSVKSVTADLQRHTRFSDEDLLDTFARMSAMTGKAQQSLQNLSLATDVAAGLQIDLGAAGDIVARAMEGEAGRLGMLLPGLNNQIKALGETATHGEKAAVILDRLSQFTGAAGEESNTTGGSLSRLKNTFSDTAEKIGNAFLPAIQSVSDKLIVAADAMGKFVEQNQETVFILGASATSMLGIAASFGTIITALPFIQKFFASLQLFTGGITGLASTFAVITGFAIGWQKILEAGAGTSKLTSDLNELSKATGVSASKLQDMRNSISGLGGWGDEQEAEWQKVVSALLLAHEQYKNIKNVIETLPEVTIIFDKTTADLNKTLSDFGVVSKTQVEEQIKTITSLLDRNKAGAFLTAEAYKKLTDQLKELKNVISGLPRDFDPLSFNANKDWLPSEDEMTGRPRNLRENLQPEQAIKKMRELSPIVMNFAHTFADAIGGVFSRITSLADIAALKIRHVFEAVGTAIFQLFARIASEALILGILSLITGIPFIGLARGFGGAIGGFVPAPSGGGGGGGANSYNPVQPPSLSGQGGGVVVNIGNFIGEEEYANRLASILARGIRNNTSPLVRTGR